MALVTPIYMGEVSGPQDPVGSSGSTLRQVMRRVALSCVQLEEELQDNLKWSMLTTAILHAGKSKFQDVELIESGPFGKVRHRLSPVTNLTFCLHVTPALRGSFCAEGAANLGLAWSRGRCSCWTASCRAQRQMSTCTTSASCTRRCCTTPTQSPFSSWEVRQFAQQSRGER